MDKDIKRFERRLQIHNFFKDEEQSDSEDEIDNSRLAFEENPTWWPPKLHKDITELCRLLKLEIYTLCNQPKHFSNLSRHELRALSNLRKNKDIIIKKADKNSGIVIMNRSDYETKVYNMLHDPLVYKKLVTDDTCEVKKKSDTLLRDLHIKNFINEKQTRNLTCYEAKCPVFYGIPKIHKKENPLRPIVSQINGPTYKINQYIHLLLEVGEREIPFLFKDTTAFLQIIEAHKNTTQNTILVTMDVVSLYTNIPQDEAINYICEHYQETLHKWSLYKVKVHPVDTKTLQQLLQLMLTNCTFEFNGQYFSQLYGTPMGAPASVRIANIFMHKLLSTFLKQYTDLIPEFLGRLVDDIFFLWNHTEDKLIKFHQHLNDFHPTIKFEITYSHDKVNFLDATVYIENNIIKTTLYTKPTDKKQYLLFSSSHPKHIKTAIPYSQALRYKRIISDDTVLSEKLQMLKLKFTSRGYPSREVNKQIDRVYELERINTLKYKTIAQKRTEFKKFTNNSPFLPFILTYRPEYTETTRNIHTVLSDLWNNVQVEREEFKTTFSLITPKIVFKKSSNLSNLLIRAKYNIHSIENNTVLDTTTDILAELAADNHFDCTVKKCGNIRCKLCSIIDTSAVFSSSVSQLTYKLDKNMNCSSYNVIYLITCTKCNVQYIGETSRSLRERINNHRSDIKLHKNTAIAKHFTEILHSYKHFSVIPIDVINNSIERKDKEGIWIKELHTKYPHKVSTVIHYN